MNGSQFTFFIASDDERDESLEVNDLCEDLLHCEGKFILGLRVEKTLPEIQLVRAHLVSTELEVDLPES